MPLYSFGQRVTKCTPIFLIFKNFLFTPLTCLNLESRFAPPSGQKKFQKYKKSLRFIKSNGKMSLNLVLNRNRQKQKSTANGFFSVSCALIFNCKDYGQCEFNIKCSVLASRPFVDRFIQNGYRTKQKRATKKRRRKQIHKRVQYPFVYPVSYGAW